jgi:hypothetical protein
MLKREIFKNKPVNLEDFMIAFCEARLNGDPTPETSEGHRGGGDNFGSKKKTLIQTNVHFDSEDSFRSLNITESFIGLQKEKDGEDSSSSRTTRAKAEKKFRVKRGRLQDRQRYREDESDSEKEIVQETIEPAPEEYTAVEVGSFAGLSIGDLPIFSNPAPSPKGLRSSFMNLLSPVSHKE